MAKNVKKMEIPVVNRVTLPQARRLFDIDLSDLSLNNKEQIFVFVYAASGFKDAHKAYLSAGWRAKTRNILYNRSREVLHRDRVQEALKRVVHKIIAPYANQIEYNLYKILYTRAFYKISDFYTEDGEIKPFSDIPEDLLYVIDGVKKRYFGKDAEKEIIEYQLPNRSESLRMIKEMVDQLKGTTQNTDDNQIQQLREMIFNREYSSLSESNIFEIEKARVEGKIR